LDDLLVGAPLYTVKKDGRILPDAGRVDVFYQTAEVGFCSLKNRIRIDLILFSINSYENKVLKGHVKEDD
jgi:hypothetical protein